MIFLTTAVKIKLFVGVFFSHGFSNTGGDAGYASDVEQLQSASQRQDQANAVERHVRHSCQMEEVRTFFD